MIRFSFKNKDLTNLLISAISLFALGVNLHLLATRLSTSSAGIAGCGGGNCTEVLSSRWATVLGVPITVFGSLVWLALIVSLFAKFHRFRAPLLGAVAGAALWFVFVQAVILGKFCSWCMAAHTAGLILWLLALIQLWRIRGIVSALSSLGLWAWLGLLVIGLLQVYGPLPATHRISSDHADVAEMEKMPVQWRGNGPKVEIFSGFKKLDAGALPHLGPLHAKRVVVEYFDYTCSACRVMAAYFEKYQQRYPDTLCLILMPVPMERSCNRSMPEANEDHEGACEIARLALTVWRNRPDKYPELHHWLMKQERLPAQVRVKVAGILTNEKSETPVDDPWIDQLLAANVADWMYFSAKQGMNLPKIIGPSNKILHGAPASEEEFFRVMREFLDF